MRIDVALMAGANGQKVNFMDVEMTPSELFGLFNNQNYNIRRDRAFMVAAMIMAAVGEEDLAAALGYGVLRLTEGEPLFILRGKDILARPALQAWLTAAEQCAVNPMKLESARRILDQMIRFPNAKYPD